MSKNLLSSLTAKDKQLWLCTLDTCEDEKIEVENIAILLENKYNYYKEKLHHKYFLQTYLPQNYIIPKYLSQFRF